MKNFNQDKNSNRGSYRAVCAKCSKECEVPFRPSGGRPVYCNDCFREMKNSGPRGQMPTARLTDNAKPSGDRYQVQFDAINIKLNKILEILTGPKIAPKSTAKKAVTKKIPAVKTKKPVKKATAKKK